MTVGLQYHILGSSGREIKRERDKEREREKI